MKGKQWVIYTNPDNNRYLQEMLFSFGVKWADGRACFINYPNQKALMVDLKGRMTTWRKGTFFGITPHCPFYEVTGDELLEKYKLVRRWPQTK